MAPRLTENADATTRRRFPFLYTVATEVINAPHFDLVSGVSDLINSILGLRSLLSAFFSKCLLTRSRDIGTGYEEVVIALVTTTVNDPVFVLAMPAFQEKRRIFSVELNTLVRHAM